jgi:neopullulanase
LFDVAKYWIEFGIDGWRLDVPGDIDDDSFWQEFRYRVRQANAQAYIVGEIWHEAQRWLQGDQFDAVMNYELTKPVLAFTAGKHLNTGVTHQQSNYQGITHPIDAHEFANRVDHNRGLYRSDITYAQLNLLDSHDTPRFLSCVNGDKDALKLAWLFMLTYPGAPCIYYGDEIGVDGEQDPDCRKSFPWDVHKWDSHLRSYIKDAIVLRTQNPALRRGDFTRLWSADGTYVFSRSLDGQTFLVALNTSDSQQQATVAFESSAIPRVLFGRANEISSADKRLHFSVPARSGAILG